MKDEKKNERTTNSRVGQHFCVFEGILNILRYLPQQCAHNDILRYMPFFQCPRDICHTRTHAQTNNDFSQIGYYYIIHLSLEFFVNK